MINLLRAPLPTPDQLCFTGQHDTPDESGQKEQNDSENSQSAQFDSDKGPVDKIIVETREEQVEERGDEAEDEGLGEEFGVEATDWVELEEEGEDGEERVLVIRHVGQEVRVLEEGVVDEELEDGDEQGVLVEVDQQTVDDGAAVQQRCICKYGKGFWAFELESVWNTISSGV